MAQPFDFTTPITQNTTLVARYRCGSAPYAGKWFRATTVDNIQYIPQSLEAAEEIAKIGFTTSANSWTLINTNNGESEAISPSNVVRLEFGGGWRNMGINVFFPFQYYNTDYGRYYKNLRYISGYPKGAATSAVAGNSGMFKIGTNSSATDIYNILGALDAMNIDMTGFKFDYNNFMSMIANTNNQTSGVNTTLLRPYDRSYSSTSYNGGGCLVMSSLCLAHLVLLRLAQPFGVQYLALHLVMALRGRKVLGLVANMLKRGSQLFLHSLPQLTVVLISLNLVRGLA